jgi:hypothetical protein
MLNRAALEKPFPVDLVRTRTGAFGRDLSFVEASHYIRRLNDAFESGWSWKILSHEVHGSEVLVHGVLEGGGQAKHAFGGSAITTSKSTGEIISTSDDLKSAATDALKKACSLFGIGLDLYAREAPERESPAGTGFGPRKSTNRASGAPSPDERNRLTAKQLRAVFAIGNMRELTDSEIRHASIKTFGVAPEFLSRTDASSFIDQLKVGE